eukprot:TRINITY_DN6039_c0_g1_i1.p1 TRINITY_DN6039_c0_g1~~TRINITY_DN6039_c0_g1_i1.p1  ORF type:complete len:209 (+),score=42.33 TRINITY_DN6039_c0_g1_i1:933-1559(+)
MTKFPHTMTSCLWWLSLLALTQAASNESLQTIGNGTSTLPAFVLHNTTRNARFIDDIETPSNMSPELLFTVIVGVTATAVIAVYVLNRRRKERLVYSMSKLEGYNDIAAHDNFEAVERHYGELMDLPDLKPRPSTQRTHSGSSFAERMKRAWDALSTRSLSIQSDNSNGQDDDDDDESSDSDDDSICSVCVHNDVDAKPILLNGSIDL